VVAPAFVQPEDSVGMEFLILVEALDTLRPAGSRDPERADPEEDTLLLGLDPPGKPLDQLVDVLAPPVGAVQCTAGRLVFPPAGLVREVEILLLLARGRVRDRVGIKIVIEMNAVDIVPSHNV